MTTEFSSETMEDPNNSPFFLFFFFKCWKNCIFIEKYPFNKEDDIKTLSGEEKLWIIFHWTCSKINAKGSSSGMFFRGMVCVCVCVCVCVTQLCSSLCNPMDCSPPASPVGGILQARILEWVAILFSRVSSRPWDRTLVSYIAGRFFTAWATRKAQREMVLEGNSELY